MKKLALAAALLISTAASAANGRPDVYVIRTFKVKADSSFDQVKKSFEDLNVLLAKTKGFEKRNVFFDKDQKLWVDQIKWKHNDAASSGMKAIEKDPIYDRILKLTDGGIQSQSSGERAFEFEVKE